MSFKKKLTRKQLLTQQDELITLTATIVNYIRKQGRMFIVSIAAILGVGLLVGIVSFYQTSLQNEANLLEAAAYRTYHGRVQDTASPSAGGPVFSSKEDLYRAARTKYQEVLDQYPDTPNAKRALLYIGSCSHQLGEYERAQEAYRQFLDKSSPEDVQYYEALRSLGYAQEEAGEYKSAAVTYKNVIKLTPDQNKVVPYLDLVRVYEQVKDWKQAEQVYRAMLAFVAEPKQREVLEHKLRQVRKRAGSLESKVKIPEMEIISETSSVP